MVGHGRLVIYSDAASITAENVVAELKLAAAIHDKNVMDYQYLYRYYRGITPIEGKTNDIRPKINNKVAENRAYEIVTFKTGFLVGEPIQYIGKRVDDAVLEMINQLNTYMEAESKAAEDYELAKWAHICGSGYRLTLPDAEANVELEEAPFTITIPRPHDAFVIYSSDAGHRPLAGVVLVRRRDGRVDYNIATPQTAPLRELQADGSRHPFDRFIISKTPAARWGTPDDLMGPAVFLASDASDFVNGHILYVDGGILAYIGKQP